MIDSIFDEVDKKKCLLKLIASNAIKICFSILETRLHRVKRCNPIKEILYDFVAI
jgi:hypothetical protein